jgi:hypothetical protein
VAPWHRCPCQATTQHWAAVWTTNATTSPPPSCSKRYTPGLAAWWHHSPQSDDTTLGQQYLQCHHRRPLARDTITSQHEVTMDNPMMHFLSSSCEIYFILFYQKLYASSSSMYTYIEITSGLSSTRRFSIFQNSKHFIQVAWQCC